MSEWVLNWPAWLVLGIIGLAFLIYDHIQFVQTLAGRRPAPVWKRLLSLGARGPPARTRNRPRPDPTGAATITRAFNGS